MHLIDFLCTTASYVHKRCTSQTDAFAGAAMSSFTSVPAANCWLRVHLITLSWEANIPAHYRAAACIRHKRSMAAVHSSKWTNFYQFLAHFHHNILGDILLCTKLRGTCLFPWHGTIPLTPSITGQTSFCFLSQVCSAMTVGRTRTTPFQAQKSLPHVVVTSGHNFQLTNPTADSYDRLYRVSYIK